MLLDINLPKYDGFEILENIRKKPELLNHPVVIMSATEIAPEVVNKYKMLTDCYVQKPLTMDRYLEAVRCFPQFGVGIMHVPQQ